MKKHAKSRWISFWRNLKDGYDHFEKQKVPPNVVVRNKRYVFERIRRSKPRAAQFSEKGQKK